MITPNRVASVLGSVAGLGVAVYGIVGSLPEKWQPPVLIIGGLAAHAGVVIKYLQGCQNWDQILANAGQLTVEPTKVDEDISDVEKLLKALQAPPANPPAA